MSVYKNISERRGIPGMVEYPGSVERLPNGNTLIADAGDETDLGSEVIEIDPLGNIVWQFNDDGNLTWAHSARLLNNNNVLITDTTNNRVIEVTREKKIVFNTDEWGNGTGKLSDGSHLQYPNDAYELEDGSLFFCDRNNDRAVKVDRQGNVLWEYSENIKGPHNAHILANGNMLICDSVNNKILEVSPDKEIVWFYGDGNPEILNWVRCAWRMENGNTVIADSFNYRVIEITKDGQMVWEFKTDYLFEPYDLQVLTNSNILIADPERRQVIEVDKWGNYRWVFRNYRNIGPLEEKLKNGFFKERTEEGLPRFWEYASYISEGGGKLIWDERNKPYPCPGLEYDRDGLLYIRQMVLVRPRQMYIFSAKIRTEGVNGSASIHMAFRDEYGSNIYELMNVPKGELFTGDNDWTLDTVEAIAPDNATSVELRLAINGPGKAWFKDVIFHA